MAAANAAAPQSQTRFSWKWLALGAPIAGAIAAWFLLPVQDWIEWFTDAIHDLGAWGVAAFVLVYVLATVLMIPPSVFTVAAGVAFGLVGVPLVVLSATLGASLAFLIARYGAREWFKRYVQKYPLAKAIREAVNDEGWKIVAMLRLSPVIPFNVQNYFFGTTEISFWRYVLATSLGMIPGTALYVYLGSLGSPGSEGGAVKWIFFAIGLVATGIAFWIVKRKTDRLMGADQPTN
ncbi:MAG: TVP38/TMEM64 family protein [Rhodoferax sp.]|nr:TVP38/TMEM64 family protein [Rhodoferax sp.]